MSQKEERPRRASLRHCNAAALARTAAGLSARAAAAGATRLRAAGLRAARGAAAVHLGAAAVAGARAALARLVGRRAGRAARGAAGGGARVWGGRGPPLAPARRARAHRGAEARLGTAVTDHGAGGTAAQHHAGTALIMDDHGARWPGRNELALLLDDCGAARATIVRHDVTRAPIDGDVITAAGPHAKARLGTTAGAGFRPAAACGGARFAATRLAARGVLIAAAGLHAAALLAAAARLIHVGRSARTAAVLAHAGAAAGAARLLGRDRRGQRQCRGCCEG